MGAGNVLIVDKDAISRASIKGFLEKNNYKVCETSTLQDAAKQDLTAYGALIVDLSPGDGAPEEIIKVAAGTPVIVTSSQASLRHAVQTMKAGAADYLAKPYNPAELLESLGLLVADSDRNAIIIHGHSECISELATQIDKVSPTDTIVLIEGESGTGKELVARKIHSLSSRADRQIISLNCAAIPDTLIESELFGHEKGAFAGATADRVGLVEAADNSTLFLDEIGELPLPAQARLLRVLHEGEVRRVGSVDTRRVNVRLVASTHRNLQAMVNAQTFREDLYYRLNVVKLSLPPLRDRGDDIKLLAKHFLEVSSKRHGKKGLKFTDAALKKIMSYPWPGNIRELENAVQRAVILCEKKTIGAELLAVEDQTPQKFPVDDPDAKYVSLEDYFVKFVLENQDQLTETELAEKLGISRKALWQKRQKHGIPRERGKKR